MDTVSGRVLSDQALVSDQAATRLAPPGFDPSRKLLIVIPSITGSLAAWAVRQSPYPAPDNLTAAVTAFDAALPDDPEESFAGLRMVRLDRDELQAVVWAAIESVPEIVAWNEPRSGHGAQIVGSSRFDGPAPDDDFIDLHALCGNVTRSVWREAEDDARDDEAWLASRDSDGNQEGGDGTAPSRSDDSAGLQGIAQPQSGA